MDTKICKKCNIEKNIDEFYIRYAFCKICKKMKDKDRKRYDTGWYSKNKNKVKEYNKELYINNREEILNKKKIYAYNNKEKIRNYYKVKFENDPLFKLKHYMRKSLTSNLKKNGFTKKNKSENIYGCSFEFLKEHIEKQFLPWMNWSNHGLYDGNFNTGWDIDHIIPLSSATTEEEILKLFHYTNLQPLCSKINRYVKGANVF